MPDTVASEPPGTLDATFTPGTPLLTAVGLSKSYGPVQALADVDLRLSPGEIHALVGENGSGKSTLVGIVSGTVAADSGSVSIGGVEVSSATPRLSQRLGAVTVFQDGSLIDELSVAQNLYLGAAVDERPGYRQIGPWASQLLGRYGFDIDSQLPASRLPPGDRQLVEIIRAVASRPKVLVLDEATSALDSAGVDVVLGLMREVASTGSAVLFVTHRLSEVMRVADSVTVLRDGKFQGTLPAAGVTAHRLVELMAGTRVDMEFPERLADGAEGDVVLSARGLAGLGFGPVDIDLHARQILGIAGADGNGQVPVLRAMASHGGESKGSVDVRGRKIAGYTDAVDAGVVYLSSNRRTESLFAGLTIGDNLGMGVLDQLSDHQVMRTGREKSFIAGAIDKYRIRVGHAGQSPAELSGGNQQKVALSRVLEMAPTVVLIDEPTQGVDVRSRLDIYRFLRDIADAGSAVVVVSSDASELAGLCDRIAVMSRGRLTQEIAGRDATEESIVAAFAVEHEIVAPELLADSEPAAKAVPAEPTGASARTRVRRPRFSLTGEGVRLVVLVLLMAALGAFAQSRNNTFLTTLSIYNIMLLALPLVAVAAAQFFVLLVGGIDVSVGATMTLAVVVASFWVQDGNAATVVLRALCVVLACGFAVGATNAFLVERIGLSAVIATIATLGLASGAALMLRPTAAGLISPELNLLASRRTGAVPLSLIGLVVLLAVVDVVLRRTGFGLRLRAVGLNGLFAQRLGIPTRRTRTACYLVCSCLAGLAGVLLAAQVGIGDPNAGNSFTLLAIAAPVLGGAALSGGHGSLVGAAAGAFILVISQSLVSVLGLSDGASYLFAGGLTLIALMSSAESLARVRRLLRRTSHA